MTVNDWYDQHRKLGALPDQGVARTTSGMKGWEESSYSMVPYFPSNEILTKYHCPLGAEVIWIKILSNMKT